MPRLDVAALALFTTLTTACIATEAEPEPDVGTTAAARTALGPPGTLFTRPVPRTTSWAYDARGIDLAALGPGWRTADVGTPWPHGDGPLGYGESYLATTVTSASSGHPTTVYVRRGFAIDDPARVRKLYLRVMYDDGFVFYLNGHEGGRASMPAGPVRYATLASGHEAERRYVTFDISSQIANLHAGPDNQLAVEVHQTSTGSSDLVFDAELVAWVDRPAALPVPEAIARGALWSLWDRGGDLGTAWRAPGYDDRAWSVAPGPLGYGEPFIVGDTAPGSITTYLRTTFRADGPYAGLTAEVLYDDGFVAYLNGHEIARRAMPSGPVTAATLSTGHEAVGYEVLAWDAALPYLLDGDNVLAVEVHQAAATSSDLVFDLALHDDRPWLPQVSGTDAELSAVACYTPLFGWAIGRAGTVVRTTDGGATWRRQDVGTAADLRAIDLIDGGHGWIVGDDGVVLATDDTGNSWAPRGPAGVSDGFVDVQFLDAERGWILSSSRLFRTSDHGADWVEIPLPTGDWTGVRFVDASRGWLVGAVPTAGDSWAAIYRTDDGGVTWTQQWLSGLHFAYLFGVEPTSSTTAWAFGQDSLSGHGERKMVTRDGGATWTRAAETSNESGIYDMAWVGPQLGWGVGYGGSIIHSGDGGATWSVQVAGAGTAAPTLYGVACANATSCWAVGQRGTILHTGTGGQ